MQQPPQKTFVDRNALSDYKTLAHEMKTKDCCRRSVVERTRLLLQLKVDLTNPPAYHIR